MKIYFAGSIRGGREDIYLYAEIVNYLHKYGEVLTEHVADPTLLEQGEQNLTDNEIHDRDMDWLTQSEVVVAEVTAPSLGVGYELRAAFELDKKILCLFRQQKDKNLSAMISGNSEITLGKYNKIDEAFKVIDGFFQDNQLSTR